MSDLVERLLAAIAEAEEAAEQYPEDHSDPDGVLRLCQAHREIIEQAAEARRLIRDDGRVDVEAAKAQNVDPDTWEEMEAAAEVWLDVLWILAGGYGIQIEEAGDGR